MKKLDDIPKKNIFEVPDGYFEKLPGVIQSRVASPTAAGSWVSSWRLALTLATAAILVVGFSIFWFGNGPRPDMNFEAELAQLQPEQIADYLENQDPDAETDFSSDDLIDSVRWSNKDLKDLENSVYKSYGASHKEIDEILNEYDSEL